MKHILIINTGGTIAMSEDRTTGKVSPSDENPLTQQSHLFEQFAHITVSDLFHIPSPHMTIERMYELSQFIQSQAEHFNGIIITHGTDTLEETAYFLDLVLDTKIPVVMTGAMRSANEIGSDGLANLRSALFVALDDNTAKHGVVVVMNEEIHAARYVTKTHTTNLATFQTPTFGPVGIVSKNNVLYFQAFSREQHYSLKRTDKRVILIKAYAGMESDVFEVAKHYDGVVIEGLGAGNVPPDTLDGIQALLALNIPVIMVSRAFNGITEDVYDYKGGGKQLKQMGILFTQGLSGVKARIKLIVTLNAEQPLSELPNLFTQF
ncbi:asparaginase [Aerococcaceae bacterium zg-ZUI334]|uniref:asparaginase n=1 Tax=Aerococcaceae bacterium zg-252 TaxID=2796928 RepID=UPI001B9B11C1|nr:asparaginase [Aerococcaceae bacterium zg-ZUI334]